MRRNVRLTGRQISQVTKLSQPVYRRRVEVKLRHEKNESQCRSGSFADEEAHSSIRISYGKYNSLEDAGKIVEAIRDITGKLEAWN